MRTENFTVVFIVVIIMMPGTLPPRGRWTTLWQLQNTVHWLGKLVPKVRTNTDREKGAQRIPKVHVFAQNKNYFASAF
jgi:hypothetical protein